MMHIIKMSPNNFIAFQILQQILDFYIGYLLPNSIKNESLKYMNSNLKEQNLK